MSPIRLESRASSILRCPAPRTGLTAHSIGRYYDNDSDHNTVRAMHGTAEKSGSHSGSRLRQVPHLAGSWLSPRRGHREPIAREQEVAHPMARQACRHRLIVLARLRELPELAVPTSAPHPIDRIGDVDKIDVARALHLPRHH